MPDEELKVEEAAPDPAAATPTGDGGAGPEDVEQQAPEDESAGEPEGGVDDEPVEEVADHVEVILDDVITTATKERDELRDQLLRLQAEFENYRKRLHKEAGEAGDKAVGRFVEELLPVLDALDAARAHGSGDTDPVAGLLADLLAKQGLERVGADGDVFDPTLHDAVLHEAGDDDVQTVAQVLRAGWRWRGRVLRPAMVKVVGG